MISFFHSIITEAVQRSMKNKKQRLQQKEWAARRIHRAEVELSHAIRDYLSIILGVVAAASGMQGP